MKLEEKIAQAAIDFAKKELGEEQFNNNTDAVQAISETFVCGANWAVSELTDLFSISPKHIN